MQKKNIFSWLHTRTNSAYKSSVATLPINYLQSYVHPCVIKNIPHIVYPRGLEEKQPELFAKLHQFYSKKGYKLKEDQRTKNSNKQYVNKRQRWAPILLFTASMFFENSANADIEINIIDSQSIQHQQVELQLISNQNIRNKIKQNINIHTPLTTKKYKNNNSEIALSLYRLLKKHYIKKELDPDFINDDLKQIASYYSYFPEVVTLLQTLKTKNWELSYDESNWVTTASGNSLDVEKAVISFNTRSAAQLKLNKACKQNPICIASPADALLHELLHTHSMLVNTELFLAQGGMGGVMYPYTHEYSVIDAERQLYAKMSRRDDIKRPQRREHTGRLVKANCPTCIN
jgi:hypothetical protein